MADLAVVNASPLIFLGAANRLELLRDVAPRVCAPEPVLEEVMAHGAADPSAFAVRSVTSQAQVPLTWGRNRGATARLPPRTAASRTGISVTSRASLA